MPDERHSSTNERRKTHQPLVERALRARMGRAQQWRTAEHHAGYFLPYLSPGMDLLDVGCGPGSITRGLAERVAPGRTVGVDMRPERLPDTSEDDAASPRFIVADVLQLPFEDDSFDAAHAHALFQHLSNPLGALSELHRVLRPGGVIGIGDWDRDMLSIHPAPELLLRALSWGTVLHQLGGGDPRAGRKLAERMTRAGFVRASMMVVGDGLSTGRAALEAGEHWATMYEDEATRTRLLDAGLATTAELDAVPGAWRAWGREPGAIVVTHWFCAVARKPEQED